MKKVFILVVIIIQITSCKKSSTGGGGGGNPPPPACRIVKIDITPYTPDYFVLKYDNQGRLTSIEDGPGGIQKREIVYNGKNYTLSHYNGPSLIRTILAEFATNGALIQLTEKQYSSGVLQHTVVWKLEYFNTGFLKRMQTDIDTMLNYYNSTYDWIDGNMTHEAQNGRPGPPMVPTVDIANEYLTQEYPTGDGFNSYDLTRFDDILRFGRPLIKNKNALKKTSYSQNFVTTHFWNYTYEFDIKGNVSRITGVRSDNQTYQVVYSYECD